MDYRKRRALLYDAVREQGYFTWDYMYEQEYALAHIHAVPQTLLDEIKEATERLAHLFTRTTEVVSAAADELLLGLGIPPEALTAVRRTLPGQLPTIVGRFDLSVTGDSIKMLEFNSDTPTGIVEAFHVNGHICRAYGLRDPNEGCDEHIRQAFHNAVRAYQDAGYRTQHVVFSSLGWHEEDAGTTRYLLDRSGLNGIFAPLDQLRVWQDRLQVLSGGGMQPVDLLYRLHAIEKLAEEKDEDGYRTGAHVLDMCADGTLALINPPCALLAQTKAMQALIWGLHEAGRFFTESEHRDIERYMLPTYMDNRFDGTTAYVKKPILGREGGGVSLFDAAGSELARDSEAFYWDQPMVYQQLVELPKLTVETMSGAYTGHLLWGSFFVGGRASAVIARIGERITGNLSCYVPVAVER